jgi:hypothetical protein
MNLSLLLLAGALTTSLPNLDFSQGRLDGWEGSGFSLGPARGDGPSSAFAVCSSDRGLRGRTAVLHRTFVIPPGTAVIRFRAAAYRPSGVAADAGKPLDILLEAANREMLPRQVWTASGYRDAPVLLPPLDRGLRDYQWDVSGHVGRTVRIAVMDSDPRPDCFVVCGGFRLVSADALNIPRFAEDMRKLQREHHLPGVIRLDTRHFVAMSTASESFTEYRLSNCETLHALFFDHFRRRGFAVREPDSKLMVAVFDSQVGFEASQGITSDVITGLYHRETNRLMVYDFGSNRSYQAAREKSQELLGSARTDLERERLSVALNRFHHDRRNDTNIATVMHETAHQLSFNGGLLNRRGDVPLWLAEGLACYCESTVNGAWQGIGEPNPARAAALARKKGDFIPLKDLISGDDWFRKAPAVDQVVLGYGQSWALFSLLMRDRPRGLRRYLDLIRSRRTAEHRLTDFGAAFGSDLGLLERQYRAYMSEVMGLSEILCQERPSEIGHVIC